MKFFNNIPDNLVKQHNVINERGTHRMKPTYKKLSSKELLSLIESIGLEITLETGGRHIEQTSSSSVTRTDHRSFKLTSGSDESIPISLSETFIKIVNFTEDNLKMRLFV